MKRKIGFGIVIWLMIVALFVGCAPKTNVDKTKLTFLGEKINGVFNPLFAQVASDIDICNLIFDSLIEISIEGEPVPGLAEYKAEDNGSKYIFTLSDAKFSDGSVVTAEDVAFTLELLADSAYDGSYDLSGLGIVGFWDYFDGKSDKIAGVEVIDRKNISVSLENASAAVPAAFTFGILSEKYYGGTYTQGDISGIQKLNEKPMGSGQYILSEYESGSSAVLVANEAYRKGTPKIKRLVYESTAIGEELGRLKLGEGDLTLVPSTVEYLDTAKSLDGFEKKSFASNTVGTIGFDCSDELLSDVALRQAIAYATNRRALVKQVFGDKAKVADVVDSRNSFTFTEDVNRYEFDIQKAKDTLENSGYIMRDGVYEKDGKRAEFTLMAESPNEVNDVLLPVMKNDLSKAGIIMNVQIVDFNTLIDKVFDGSAQSWVFAWTMSIEPDDTSALFETGGGINIHNYSNEKLDALYAQGREHLRRNERKEFYQKADKIINEDLPCIPLYERDSILVYKNTLRNVTASGNRSVFKDFYKIEVKD
ncbi:MAG: ABC transporter substrate-binding protein [Eubacteriales bacterium]|nr:ABC transporter substrate-binding protein [Eubacteriales bacterium]